MFLEFDAHQSFGREFLVILERRNGQPVFGPESPIATKAECDAVNGDFHPSLFGWMIHANVVEGHDLASIWGDDHHGEPHEHR